jgi:hypothetical protein
LPVLESFSRTLPAQSPEKDLRRSSRRQEDPIASSQIVPAIDLEGMTGVETPAYCRVVSGIPPNNCLSPGRTLEIIGCWCFHRPVRTDFVWMFNQTLACLANFQRRSSTT